MKRFHALLTAALLLFSTHGAATPDTDSRKDARAAQAKADADYRAARAACEAKSPNAEGAKDSARSACLKQAAAAQVAAREEARVQEKCASFSGSAKAFCVSEEKVRPSNR